VHLAHVKPLNELQQVSIYMAGPLEPLKTNMELQNPQDIEKAMSLARAYKR
jgi:hypothetical protein